MTRGNELGALFTADCCHPPEQGMVHHKPGDRPLCGDESAHAVCTDDPNQVVGCTDCLELAAEDLEDSNRYAGRYLHCRETISAVGGVAWRRAVRQPCPRCGRAGW